MARLGVNKGGGAVNIYNNSFMYQLESISHYLIIYTTIEFEGQGYALHSHADILNFYHDNS